MSAEIRHFGKPLFVIQMETKEVGVGTGQGRALWRMREGTCFCLARILKFGSEI